MTYGLQDQRGLWLVTAKFQDGRDIHTEAGPRHRALGFSDKERAEALVKALNEPVSHHEWRVAEFAPRPPMQRLRDALHLPATMTDDDVIASVVGLVEQATR